MDKLDSNDNVDSGLGKGKFHFIQDAALIVSVMTGIGYVMAFSFRKGMREYYGITDLANNEISISMIFQSINEMDLEILLVAFTYVLIQLIARLYAPFINIALVIINKFYKCIIFTQVIKKKPNNI
ncbi:hypothetical protein KM918_25040 [Priestia megaterium]|uniref:hypothetical protein n=1 Tax=Priestia megaterium TaxID=1404 RepID=UPI001C210915|nr:hypothetical protein [Priestia megaterium]MBU8690566.1 hypothetical protein [Priestia megaterium]